MYCSSCGKTVNPGLIYCSSCGAMTGAGERESETRKMSESSFNLLVAALIMIPILGIGAFIALLAVMKAQLGFDNPMILAITFMGFLLLLTSELALIWLLLHQTRHGRVDKTSKKHQELTERYSAPLNNVVRNALQTGEGFEPVPSVVDSTTRTLEPQHHKQKRHNS